MHKKEKKHVLFVTLCCLEGEKSAYQKFHTIMFRNIIIFSQAYIHVRCLVKFLIQLEIKFEIKTFSHEVKVKKYTDRFQIYNTSYMCTLIYLHYARRRKKSARQTMLIWLVAWGWISIYTKIWSCLSGRNFPRERERKREKKQQTKKKNRPNPTMRDRAGILLTIIPVVYFVLVGTRSV